MKELIEITAAFDALCGENKPCALATVIAVEGSSYRLPGARMLVAADGRTWGGVSGGCLERDVARRALGVIETGRPVRCRYDTGDDEELLHGAATGCGGTIHLYLQPLSANRPGPLPHIAEVLRTRQPLTIATTLDDGQSRVALASDSLPVADAKNVFVETILPPQAIVIFGAGPDVPPLVAIAKTLGWHVTVVASRPATGVRERLAAADSIHVTGADAPADGVPLPDDAAVLLMTHNLARDRLILAALPPRLRYVGILGPASRTRRLFDEVPVDLSRLHAPVGLDLGAQTPEEIALAIAAEIQAVVRNAAAGFLRDRPGPIHDRRPASPDTCPA
jgi:xanthine/CO dehydrogenase XdhC/CoxF family maturation factor